MSDLSPVLKGIPNQAQDVGFGGEDIGAQVPEQAQPIDPQIDPNALERLKIDFFKDLEQADSAKTSLKARVSRWRDILNMDPPPQLYDGQPVETMPYSLSKIMGAQAHYREALDLDPFFITRPYTASAAKSSIVWETMMERELDRSKGRRQLWYSLREDLETGTGVLGFDIYKNNGEWVVQPRSVMFENMLIAPDTDKLQALSTFERFSDPFHLIRRRAAEGIYDKDAVDRIEQKIATTNMTTNQEKDGTNTPVWSRNLQPQELYESFYFWFDAESGVDAMIRVIASRDPQEILRVEIDHPYKDIIDGPPYQPVRHDPEQHRFWGRSYMQRLEGVQTVMDFALNAKLAYDQFAITPMIFVDEHSEAHAQITGLGGVVPNTVVPVRGVPKDSIFPMVPPQTGESENLISLMKTLGEDATFSDLQLNGLPIGTVRSATEISAVMNAATKKLATDLSNIAMDLADFADMYWSLIYAYKIEREGVVQVFNGDDQFLIANQEIQPAELAQRALEFMGVAQPGEELPPDAQDFIEQLLADAGLNIFIASAVRDDLQWLPNGSKLAADKELQANNLERIIQQIVPALTMIRSDLGVYNMYRDMLQARGFYNWREYLQFEPPAGPAADEQLQVAADRGEQVRQGGGAAAPAQ